MVNFRGRNAAEVSASKRIYCETRIEFADGPVDPWFFANGVVTETAWPGAPPDNLWMESFKDTLRDECLNVHWFGDFLGRTQGIALSIPPNSSIN